MSRRSIALACILAFCMSASVLAAKKKKTDYEDPIMGSIEVSSFVMIVNSANPIEQLPSSVISDYYYKKQTAWPNGTAVMPVDQKVDSKVRSMFTLAIHFKRPAAVQSYWQKKLFAGEDVPPPELASDVEVLEFVSQNPGAIGYVPGGWQLSQDVKILQVTQ